MILVRTISEIWFSEDYRAVSTVSRDEQFSGFSKQLAKGMVSRNEMTEKMTDIDKVHHILCTGQSHLFFRMWYLDGIPSGNMSMVNIKHYPSPLIDFQHN